MVLVQELIRSVATLINIFFTIIYWMLVARIVLGLVGVNPYTHTNEVLNVLYQVTDAILAPFRKLPLQFGGFDFSPIVAFFVLQFLNRMILLCLYSLARVAA
jgi:YggT family protein